MGSLARGLKSASDGVTPGRTVSDGIERWSPAKERSHPDTIEGTIASVSVIENQLSKYEWDKTTTVLVIKTDEPGVAWRVYAGPRDLRNKVSAVAEANELDPGREIAIKYFGKRTETAKDGTPYQVDSYALAVGDTIGEVPTITGKNRDGQAIWSTDTFDMNRSV